jgi:hypothetical protein
MRSVATNAPGIDASPTPAVGGTDTSPIPWRALLRQAAGLWLVGQVVLIAFTYTALTFTIANSLRTAPAVPVTPASFYEAWVRLDGNWYVQIATHGYSTAIPDTLGFFPFYPLLIRVAAFLCFGNAALAAVLVARLADFGVCLGVLALAWQEFRGDVGPGRLALAITLAFPLAFFLGAAYAESLFLTEVCFTLLFARRRAWGPAALVAFVAGVTHPRGLVLIAPLAWEWARTERPWQHWRAWRTWRTGALALGAIPLSYIALAATFAVATGGNALAFLQVHSHFGRTELPPWEILRLAFGILLRSSAGTLDQAHNFYDIGLVLLASAIVVVAAVRRQMPGAFVAFSVALILGTVALPTPGQSDAFLSAGRAIVALVPIFLILARWAEQRPWLTWVLIGGGLYLQATLAAFWVNGGFLI